MQTAPIGNQTPTATLPDSAHPSKDGVSDVLDVGLISDIDTSGGAPVLVWDRISYQQCTPQQNCPDGFTTQNNSPLLRRYQVASGAKVLLSDPNDPSAPARSATVGDLKSYAGSGKIFIVSAGPDGTVSTIGQPYQPSPRVGHRHRARRCPSGAGAASRLPTASETQASGSAPLAVVS